MSPAGGVLAKSSKVPARNEIRLIAGEWRSRKLRFPDIEGLRPTPDRVRETLFNWLRDDVEGARCLDLYSGSGALGFEAASRGAARVIQVESDPRVVAALRHHCELLSATQVHVRQENVRQFLTETPEAGFDIVFLDPPFRRGWLVPTCVLLERGGWLAEHARIYLEAERELKLDGLPATWQRLRHGEAGDVAYALYQRNPRTSS